MVRGLVHWAGFPRPLVNLRQEMDQLFDQFLSNGGDWTGGETPVLAPRTNLAETAEAYEVAVELPGLKPEDFHVELKNGELWISGEKKQEVEDHGKTWHRTERYYGQFRRVLPLATDVDADKVEAQYTDGVLRLRLPKAATAKPKQIQVKS